MQLSYGLQSTSTLPCLAQLSFTTNTIVSGAVMVWFKVKTVKAGAVIVYIQRCHVLYSFVKVYMCIQHCHALCSYVNNKQCQVWWRFGINYTQCQEPPCRRERQRQTDRQTEREKERIITGNFFAL